MLPTPLNDETHLALSRRTVPFSVAIVHAHPRNPHRTAAQLLFHYPLYRRCAYQFRPSTTGTRTSALYGIRLLT